MKVGIIGAGKEALHTIKKAKEYGLTVVALDGNEKAEGLKEADIGMVVDISKEEQVLKAIRKEQVSFLLTAPIGRYLTTTGIVNELLQLPGIGREETLLCTDKLLFHKRMEEYHLRNCRCYQVSGDKLKRQKLYQDIRNKVLELPFPAILKPRHGSGSRGIYFLSDELELSVALEKTEGEEYLLEECVEGEEYGVDGSVVGDHVQLILLRHKKNTPVPYRQAVAYCSVLPGEPFYSKAEKYLKQAVKALGLKECLFHADLICKKGDPFLIELSARPSGHNLHNLFTPLCTGVDMAEEYIKYRMGIEYSFVPQTTKKMLIHYFDLEGRVEFVPSLRQLEDDLSLTFLSWECKIKEGDILKKVSEGHSLMERGHFILEGSSEEELMRKAEQIKGKFVLKIRGL